MYRKRPPRIVNRTAPKIIAISVHTVNRFPLIYASWIYSYLWNQCLSPLTLWVRTPLRWGVLDTTLCDQVSAWLMTGRWFSPGNLVSSTNKTDHNNITEILLKVALSTMQPINYTTVQSETYCDICIILLRIVILIHVYLLLCYNLFSNALWMITILLSALHMYYLKSLIHTCI